MILGGYQIVLLVIESKVRGRIMDIDSDFIPLHKHDDFDIGRHGWLEHRRGEGLVSSTKTFERRKHLHLVYYWASD